MNAYIHAMTPVYRQSDGVLIRFGYMLHVHATIIPEDITVTEFIYKGVTYTVDTKDVVWKQRK